MTRKADTDHAVPIHSALVIDDHPLYCDALASMMETVFNMRRVRKAASLSDALQVLRSRFAPDLVVLDLNLPDVSGLSGFMKIKDKAPDVPVVVISAFAVVTDIQFKPAYVLAQLLDEPAHKRAILAEAKALTAEQAHKRLRAEPLLSASEVMRRLIEATEGNDTRPAPLIEHGKSGRPVVTVMSSNRQGITLKIHSGAGADHEEAIAAIRRVLDSLEKQNRGLQR